MLVRREWVLLAVLLTVPMTAATGNVITEWDEKAVNLVQPGTVFPPPTAFRTITILHVAMFDAVNSIEPRYKPYKVQLPASPDTSKEAAAAAAAAAVLIKLVPDAGSDIQSTFDQLSRDLARWRSEIQRHRTRARGRDADSRGAGQ